MKIRGHYSLVLLFILVLFVAVACQQEQPQPQTPTPPPANNPADQENETPPEITEGQYEDGNFTAEGEADERGWTPMIEITVADGEITEVTYDEKNEEGTLKSEDEDYNQRWQDGSGTSAPEAYQAFATSLIDSQNPDQVETVTGATSAHEKFVTLAKEALNK